MVETQTSGTEFFRGGTAFFTGTPEGQCLEETCWEPGGDAAGDAGVAEGVCAE